MINASQNSVVNKATYDSYCEALERLGYEFTTRKYDPQHGDQHVITITGSKADKLKFLGEIRPSKLFKLDIEKLGILPIVEQTEIVSITPVGNMEVCGLGTSTGTYIVEGYPCHNTGFDFPYMRAKALHYNIPFPGYGDLYHWDVYYTVKSKLKISRKSLDNACDYLGIVGKTPISKDAWRKAKYGDPASLKYVLDHNLGDVDILEELHDRLEFTRQWNKRSV